MEIEEVDAEVLKKYIFGGHVAEYMETLADDDEERYRSQFVKYIEDDIETDALHVPGMAVILGVDGDRRALASAADIPSLSPLTLLFLTTGTTLCSPSANALNMLYEPDTDAKMSRTRARPLVRKLLSTRAAVLFAIGCGVAGTAAPYLGVNPTASFLGLRMLDVSEYFMLSRTCQMSSGPLLDFPYGKYGIVLPPVEVENDERMVEGGKVADGEVVQVVGTILGIAWRDIGYSVHYGIFCMGLSVWDFL
ncbi:ribosomal L18 C-terminal region-domain-containing protein [Chaetomium strumarium]|uniref:Protoheme IX farnesyltransferase, mitochondrial n=1 Tax=Chaetomium strumarium TaxID=1170767 RepID=A0AAJ0H0V0_9PEZI|nr:ribosomal L18 C-terminal region-domain-containing protein [Chaetomium strumarium]